MADDGSRLWLKYDLIKDQKQKLVYQKYTQFISLNTYHPILQKAAEELQSGFVGLLGSKTKIVENSKQTGGIVLEVSNNQSLTSNLAKDGFAIFSQNLSCHSPVSMCWVIAFALLSNWSMFSRELAAIMCFSNTSMASALSINRSLASQS
jgi:alpha-glucuronidase